MPDRPVILVPYCARWPAEFRRMAAQIRAALEARALRIDHIGSTAVPGLCSKDIIDIQVTVEDLRDPALLGAIAAAGFELRPQIVCDHVPPGDAGVPADWEKRYFREVPGNHETHVHVRVAGRPNQRYPLLFRDYLRAHWAAAAAYAQVKQRLAPLLERSDYVDAKDPICDLIMQAAEAWAGNAWRPGPGEA